MENVPAELDSIAAGPPAAFVRLVRDALVHLYDSAHLMHHPFAEMLAPVLPYGGDSALELRNLLLDAIENLEPPRHERVEERERRPYLVLMHRYVDGFATEDIVARLHISPRQFQREHLKGLLALAAQLWGRRQDGLARLGGESAAASLQTEIESLGLQLDTVPMSQLLDSVRAPAEALAGRHAVPLALLPVGDDARCACDRTLARQALLSCLSCILAKHPHSLQVAALGRAAAPSIQVSISPPLTGTDGDDVIAGVATCRTLMAAQGGAVHLVADDSGRLMAVHLLFRPRRETRVLVVDDNEKMLQLYERYLAQGHYAVTTAASAERAEEALAQSVPDAIVLDVMMRGVDGWELLQRLRLRPELRPVPVIVCSILSEADLALALGADAYIKKPVSPDELLDQLARLLAGSSPARPSPAAP
ncbi:MAG: response regulator transcription factor [Anaerolineae bacterium]